ncbi:MAG: polyamine ABC transporter substrate-binding protein [Pseudomonadota bacterium]
MFKRMLSVASVLAVVAPMATGALAQEEKVLNVYNWFDYIGESTIADFEKETGIKVNYDTFDSNEILEAKLLAGNSGYDVVVPSANFMERQIQAGVFMELDRDKLSNYSNLDEAILDRVSVHDEGNAHSVPYMWGTTGFGYNVADVTERMADAPVDSWDLIFKPEIVSKFADCGVAFIDSPAEVMGIALNYLGLDPNSEKKKDLEKAQELMLSIRPYIKYFNTGQYLNDIANGEVCIAVGYSGDFSIAQVRAEEAGQGIEIAYVIPNEGTQMWFDMLAIPEDAPHAENAHAFIDFILRPEVAAGVSNYVFYANPNKAATELVDPAITGDPSIYPNDDTKANLFAMKAHTPKYDRKLTRAWTKVKTGR